MWVYVRIIWRRKTLEMLQQSSQTKVKITWIIILSRICGCSQTDGQILTSCGLHIHFRLTLWLAMAVASNTNVTLLVVQHWNVSHVFITTQSKLQMLQKSKLLTFFWAICTGMHVWHVKCQSKVQKLATEKCKVTSVVTKVMYKPLSCFEWS